METMDEYIEQIRKRYNIDSDYRLAQLLGVTRQAIHHHKIGRAKHVSEETAYQIAALLGLDPKKVLLTLAIEKAKNERIKRLWQSIAKELSKTTAAIFLTLMVAIPAPQEFQYVYYVKCRRRDIDTLAFLWG